MNKKDGRAIPHAVREEIRKRAVSRVLAGESPAAVIEAPAIRMVSDCAEDIVVEHSAPNGRHFSVRDMIAAAEETDRQARPTSEWFEGIDVHHVYLEGIHLEEDGLWVISYGS